VRPAGSVAPVGNTVMMEFSSAFFLVQNKMEYFTAILGWKHTPSDIYLQTTGTGFEKVNAVAA